ncbi:hypothetical protein I541_5644 [Mycobacteroides abscessus]|nr:hypothetical protein I541_5644 [Mycobacteroides abscessus]
MEHRAASLALFRVATVILLAAASLRAVQATEFRHIEGTTGIGPVESGMRTLNAHFPPIR